MGKQKAAKAFRNVFYVNRKPGRFSPKSIMFYSKFGPRFSKLTPQQLRIKDAGKKCGELIQGQFPGSGGVKDRRIAMGACIRKTFGKKVVGKGADLLSKIGYS